MRCLLLFILSLSACAEADRTNAPSDPDTTSPPLSTDADATETPVTKGKADDVEPHTKAGATDDEDDDALEHDDVLFALQACDTGTLDAAAFDAAYAQRLCEEWEACDGTDCDATGRSALSDDPSETCELDPEAACACLASAWTCSPSYGAAGDLWVVIPEDACFAAYICD